MFEFHTNTQFVFTKQKGFNILRIWVRIIMNLYFIMFSVIRMIVTLSNFLNDLYMQDANIPKSIITEALKVLIGKFSWTLEH